MATIRDINVAINDNLIEQIKARDQKIEALEEHVATLEDYIRELKEMLSGLPWKNEDYPN